MRVYKGARMNAQRIIWALGILGLFSWGGLSFADTPRTVFVHLFEWKWNDIAQECEDFLGPKGFSAVQVSPPNEHKDSPEWWSRYQPVSFGNLNSRSGSEDEFRDMVRRCKAAGVSIYVDAVINHTASKNGPDNHCGVASGGSSWCYMDTPEFDWHHYHNECGIAGYTNLGIIHNCQLSGLPDLDTGNSDVQNTLASYLKKLKKMGVAGFRIDAAKHINPNDLRGILNKAGNPWNFMEVIRGKNEAVKPEQYTDMGLVLETKYANDLYYNFENKIHHLLNLNSSWGLLPSDKAVVYIDNHDSERDGPGTYPTYNYKYGAKYNLANVYMLAYPYAYPKILSSYKFSSKDDAPPSAYSSFGGCGNSDWVCQHRWNNIANMVAFRNNTASEWRVTNKWSNGNNQIAFGRGSKGFVAINNEGNSLNTRLQTGMAAGTYCNVLSASEPCGGEKIVVDDNGFATFNVAPMAAAAIHIGEKL